MKKLFTILLISVALLFCINDCFANDINNLLYKASKGDMEAQYQVGYRYAAGVNVSQDFKEARKWFYRAAIKGHPKAQDNLAYIYLKGYGVTKDSYRAIEWFLKASEQGYADSSYSLGRIYKFGDGVRKDKVKSFKFFKRAAKQGNPVAQNYMGTCYTKGTPSFCSKNITTAIEWFTKSAKQGDMQAIKNLNLAINEKKGMELSSPILENKEIWTDAAKVIGAMWLLSKIEQEGKKQSELNQQADCQSKLRENDYNYCWNEAFRSKRVLTCQVSSGVYGDQITCEGVTGLFNKKISKCRGKVEFFACGTAWSGGCASGTYYCDSETMFVDTDAEVVIDKICGCK